MQITTYGSSSRGNLYKVQIDGGQSLLFEAGLPINAIKEITNYNIPRVCLISHSHMDHARAAKELIKLGVNCYMHKLTAETLELTGHRVKIVEFGDQIDFGEWIALFFPTQHDCKGSMGWLVLHKKTGKKLLFATDTYYLRQQFKGVNIAMIECNYCMDILKSNIEQGRIPKSVSDRLLQSHFELENVKRFFNSMDCSQLERVLLLHLSDNNSDQERMVREIRDIVKCDVEIAGG